MSRPVAASLLALTLFFGVLPLTLDKPGMPAGLKADEAAYYMMALSLAHDGDLRMEQEDVARVFEEFPFGPVDNLIVMTDDAWRSVYFGKPYLYSLFAAPFAGLAGANGMLCFNMLLHLGMVWLGTLWLGRFNPSGAAALFSAGFFFASAGFAYVFWLQPEVFSMAAVAVACFAAFHGLAPGAGGVDRGRWWPAAVSGAALALAAYNKPVFALLAVALVWAPARRRQWRRLAAWVAGFAASLGLAAGLAVALTGHPTSYLGVERQGVTLCEPGVMPIEPRPVETSGPPADRPTGGAWSWIFRVPRVPPGELLENLGYFLWGRHTGLLLYLPFAVVAAILFLLHGRRRGEGWALVAALAGVALFFLVFIPHNWQGGGGFVGNRYFVGVYPAFLFLATRLRPAALAVGGWAWAGLFLGPLVLTPFGRSVPEPTLQSHVRGVPFRLFPLELSLREVPGYADRVVGGRRFTGRRDVFLPRGDAFWVRGATDAELWITGEEPVERAVFLVSSPAPGNRVRLELGDAEAELEREGI